MSVREKRFRAIVERTSLDLTEAILPSVSWSEVEFSDFEKDVIKVYGELGGSFDTPTIAPGKWDFELNGVAVEFDDALHFNRYRLLTLRSPFYSHTNSFSIENYRRFCMVNEKECLKSGKAAIKWTNKGCEKEYGPSGEAGKLSGNGSPRWRQRAFDDFIKDATPRFFPDLKVVRISIWDELLYKGYLANIKDILYMKERGWELALIRYIERRVNTVLEK